MSSQSPLPDAGAEQAAQGPIPTAVSAATNPLPAQSPTKPTDSPDDSRGRRILSTAFVRLGPDGQLTVELRGGRVLVLRDVTMGLREYCGRPVGGRPAGKRYCGRYADVSAAQPGGGSVSDKADSAAANPLSPKRTSPRK